MDIQDRVGVKIKLFDTCVENIENFLTDKIFVHAVFHSTTNYVIIFYKELKKETPAQTALEEFNK